MHFLSKKISQSRHVFDKIAAMFKRNGFCGTAWTNLREDWRKFVEDVEKSPLGFLVFLGLLGLFIGLFLWTNMSMGASYNQLYLIVIGWVAAFFAYRRAKAVEYGMNNAQKSKLGERYIQSCTMLGNDTSETVQMSGLINLDLLARQEKEDYRQPVLKIVCWFIKEQADNEKDPLAQRAVDIFLKKQEGDSDYYYEGLSANLSGAKLEKINLKYACLSGADLRDAKLFRVNDAQLDYANLSGSTIDISSLELAATFKNAIVPEHMYEYLTRKKYLVIKGESHVSQN